MQFNFSKRNIFLLVNAVILVLLLIMVQSAGNSGDQCIDADQAKKSINYFKTGGEDKAILDENLRDPFYIYGFSPDVITVFVSNVLHIDKIYEVGNIFCVLQGFLIILLGGLIVSQFFGWWAAILASLMLFLTPSLVGHSFNNLKDIPFAFTFMACMYSLIRFLKMLPKISKKWLILITLSIAYSISIRIGGLLLIPYVCLFVAIYYFMFISNGLKNAFTPVNFKLLKKIIGVFVLVFVAAYFIGLLLWPYAWEAPLSNPFKALKMMEEFPITIGQIFEGKKIPSTELPSTYLFKWIFIGTPIVTIIGFILLFTSLKTIVKDKQKLFFVGLLLFCFFFPLLYIIYKKSNVYGGFRQVLFIYPFLIMLATVGFWSLYEKFSNKYAKYGVLVLVGVLLILPLKHYAKNHPYEYIYFNEFAGGVNKCYGNYETDYYYHGVKEASMWLLKNKYKKGDTIRVATNHSAMVAYYFRNNKDIKVSYVRYYERSKKDWDYYIASIALIGLEEIQSGAYPNQTSIYNVDVDRKTICSVLERKSKGDYFGYEALKNKDYPLAYKGFSEYYKLDNSNSSALEGFMESALALNKIDTASIIAEQIIKISPENYSAIYYLGRIYAMKGAFDKAIPYLQRYCEIDQSNVEVRYYLGFCYAQLGKMEEASQELQRCVSIDSSFKPAITLLINILEKTGNTEQANNLKKML